MAEYISTADFYGKWTPTNSTLFFLMEECRTCCAALNIARLQHRINRHHGPQRTVNNHRIKTPWHTSTMNNCGNKRALLWYSIQKALTHVDRHPSLDECDGRVSNRAQLHSLAPHKGNTEPRRQTEKWWSCHMCQQLMVLWQGDPQLHLLNTTPLSSANKILCPHAAICTEHMSSTCRNANIQMLGLHFLHTCEENMSYDNHTYQMIDRGTHQASKLSTSYIDHIYMKHSWATAQHTTSYTSSAVGVRYEYIWIISSRSMSIRRTHTVFLVTHSHAEPSSSTPSMVFLLQAESGICIARAHSYSCWQHLKVSNHACRQIR